jgi:predicted amidohydrolase YtcJ
LILRNLRLDGAAVDIRIENGLIVELGDLAGQGHDFGGRTVIPGLWDNHVHFSQWAMQSQRLDLSAATSAREVAEIVGAAATGPTFVAVGFRDGLWPDLPTVALLDETTGDVPVVLISGDLHCVWANSAALALYGYVTDDLLREEPAFEVTRAVGRVDNATLDGWARTAGAAAAKRGVVGFADLEMSWNLDTWQRRMTAGFDSQRVEFAIYTQHLDRAIELGLSTGQKVGRLLSVGRYKVLTDGSLNTRTAYCVDPFPGTENYGLLEISPQTLQARMRQAWREGIEATVHAIGDAALTVALDAFEAVGARGWVEHAQLVADSDLRRFAELGVTASVQPEHAMDDRDVADRYWAGRTHRVIPLRSLRDAGARIAFGSDAPVAPLDPWVTMAAAVSRSRDGREPWHPEQSVTVAEALAASTRSTVAVGQPADLVIIGSELTAQNLRSMPVHATLLAGRFTHREAEGASP